MEAGEMTVKEPFNSCSCFLTTSEVMDTFFSRDNPDSRINTTPSFTRPRRNTNSPKSLSEVNNNAFFDSPDPILPHQKRQGMLQEYTQHHTQPGEAHEQ